MRIATEYRVSERVVLRAGDTFRARGGPYWKNGRQRISLAAPGPFTFIEAHYHDGVSGRVSLLAVDRDGHRCELRVAGSRWVRISASVIPRLYTITGKKRQRHASSTSTSKGRRRVSGRRGTGALSAGEPESAGVTQESGS
jgi:hypothetical protein